MGSTQVETKSGLVDSGPVCRTVQDEQADFDEVVKNFSTGAYRDWPNEAGFDGLEEERGPIPTTVIGTIPTWAAGSLYRTGPGIFKVEGTPKGTFHSSHWFDGLAQSHCFEITANDDGSNCEVLYSSRRQCDGMVDYIKKHGERKGTSFGQKRDPCIGLFGKFMSVWKALRTKPEVNNLQNVCVTVHGDLPGLQSTKLVPAYSSPDTKRQAPPEKAVAGSGHRSGMSGDVWLLSDISTMQKIDPHTLEPIGFVRQDMLHPDLKGHLSSAHAQRDPDTGDVFNFNLEFGKMSTYRVFRLSKATGKTEILATIQRPDLKPAYIHSLWLSPSFVILCVPSTHLGMGGIKVLWENNIIDAIEPFKTTNKCKWFIVDRLHGKGVVAEFETDAGFFFHTINAFEERDDTDTADGTVSLSCDVIDYVNHDVMFTMYYDVLLQRNGAAEKMWANEKRIRDSVGRLSRYRFRVPVATGAEKSDGPQAVGGAKEGAAVKKCPNSSVEKTISILGPHAGELPTINPHFVTKRHRYVYSLPSRGLSTISDTIAKTDMETREAKFWNNPKGHTPGEAIFVPRPGGTEEDDGVLLSVVLDGVNKSSYLLCLDACSMTEVGRAEVGIPVALGFHGMHSEH